MSRRTTEDVGELELLSRFNTPTGRRSFLKWSGAALAVTAVGCSDDGSGTVVGPIAPGDPEGAHLTPPEDPNTVVNLGTGDLGVLNYAYALEQLEAAFYTLVVGGGYFASAKANERAILDDVRAHEVIHREFLYTVLNANNAAIPGLRFDFSSVDFDDRDSVLATSVALEDTGVSAYNGAAQLLQTLAFIAVAGKIVSVEARHASVFRDLVQPKTGNFAGDDIINSQGLDLVRVPAMVLPIAGPFIQTPLDASGLPTPQYVPASATATVSA